MGWWWGGGLHTLSTWTVSAPQTHGDEGVYWQVNFERFHLHFRDQTIISAVASKLDQVRMRILDELCITKSSEQCLY